MFICSRILHHLESLTQRGAPALLLAIHDMLDGESPALDVNALAHARAKFNDGDFSDAPLPLLYRLLFAFVRELPQPLVPSTMYSDALALVASHARSAGRAIATNGNFGAWLASFSDLQARSLETYLAQRQHPDDDCDSVSAMGASHLDEDQVRPLATVFDRFAFSCRSSLSALEELYFELPRVNRHTLEYIGVFFAKVDLIVRRTLSTTATPTAAATTTTATAPPSSSTTTSTDDTRDALVAQLTHSYQQHPSAMLRTVASSLAPHLLRPIAWSASGSAARARTRAAQAHFLLLFFFFIKKKVS